MGWDQSRVQLRYAAAPPLTCIKTKIAPRHHFKKYQTEEAEMKLSIALSTLLVIGVVVASTETAGAIVYCQYVEYPAGCVVKPGVVLKPRPVAGAAVVAPVARPVDRAVDRPVEREMRR
jgi:hypothetical protein